MKYTQIVRVEKEFVKKKKTNQLLTHFLFLTFILFVCVSFDVSVPQTPPGNTRQGVWTLSYRDFNRFENTVF